MQKCPPGVYLGKSFDSNAAKDLNRRSGRVRFRIFSRCFDPYWSQICLCLSADWKKQTPVWPTLQWTCWFRGCRNQARGTCRLPDEAWMCARRLAEQLGKIQIQILVPFQRLGEFRSISGCESQCWASRQSKFQRACGSHRLLKKCDLALKCFCSYSGLVFGRA